jgi:hypothetical protein
MYRIANSPDTGYRIVPDNSSRIPDPHPDNEYRIPDTGYRIVGGEKRMKFGWELAQKRMKVG